MEKNNFNPANLYVYLLNILLLFTIYNLFMINT